MNEKELRIDEEEIKEVANEGWDVTAQTAEELTDGRGGDE